MDIFRERDYKNYLRERISLAPAEGHGLRSKLARALNCQTAYISRVLNGDAHLSAEQAMATAVFFDLGQEETQFFLTLVQFTRAGTPALRKHLQSELDQAAQKRLILRDRLKVKEAISPEDHAIYFGHWHYAAVHALISVPAFQETNLIARRLHLPPKRAQEVLDFLLSRGLIQRKKDKYAVGTRRLHLAADSSMVNKHHVNWRLRAIHSLDHGREEDLHYSSVITCGEKDALKIKAAMVDVIEEIRATVRDAKDEDLYSYSLDIFRV